MARPQPTSRGHRRRRPFPTVLAIATAISVSVAGPVGAQEPTDEPPGDEPPSILLVVTDDQRWDTLWAMPEVQRSLVAQGMTFTNAFTTSPLCCPSRASILTGAYPHATGVYTQGPPHGGFQAFDDSTTIATELQDAGYATGYFGKYLDSYQSASLSGYVPPGWDRWAAFVHAEYFDYGLTLDGEVQRYGTGPDDYSTDVLAGHAEAFLRSSDGPVFAVFAPAAPHEPALPAPGDEALFEDLPPWSPPAFDEPDRSDKPRYVRAFRRLGAERTVALEDLRKNQYRSLQAVDRGVGRLLDALEETGRLNDALILYTSDNGLLWGEHRWLKKEVPYEEAIRVPLVVRADAVLDGADVDGRLVSNVDIAPTIAEIARVELPGAEGMSVLPLLRGDTVPWRPAVLIEHVRGTNPIPTYCAVRTDRHLFVRYQTDERELYDLTVDPSQLVNLTGTRPALEARLETTLRNLCDPAPPGLGREVAGSLTIVALVVTLGLAALARKGFVRRRRR